MCSIKSTLRAISALTLVGVASAAPLTISSAPFTDVTQVSTTGTLVEAINNNGASDAVMNGITFTSGALTGSHLSMMPGSEFAFSNSTGFRSGAANRVIAGLAASEGDKLFDNALISQIGSGGGPQVTLSGLNSGANYELQFWIVDDRDNNSANRNSTVTVSEVGGGNTVGPLDYTFNDATDASRVQLITINFTADGATQDFDISRTNAAAAWVNAYQLRTTSGFPGIQSFTASPLWVTSETETTTLSWSVSDATSVSISPGVGSVAASGTTVVTPGGNQTYTLSATNEDGTSTSQVSITLYDQTVPNIVIFIVDDFGWQDTSYEFWDTQTLWNALYKTPGMERLAAQGRAFTNAYASAPVCTATRISIMLGQAPVRHGTTFISGNNGENTATIKSASQVNAGLTGEKQDRTLPKLLSNRGYRSITIGKAHFGPDNPLNVGFDINRYGADNGTPQGNGSDQYHQMVDGVDTHFSEALTLAAKEEIDASIYGNEPFFLYMSHYAVHKPILEDSRFSANYDSNVFPTDDNTTRAMCTLIEGMDKSLNDLLDHLDAAGIAEKTLIFFTSDHGGLSYRAGSSYYDDPPAPNRKFNWPLRGGKSDVYEGGLRIPCFVAWGKNDPTEPMQQALPITAGSVEDRPIIHADLMPTIMGLTGFAADIPSVVDGQDFSGYITGDANFAREDKFFWHGPNFWVDREAKPDSAMRDGKYKLVYTYDETDGIWELFDLDLDIGETTNLMDSQPEVGVRMARELIRYLESENANYPILKSTDEELPPVLPSQASLVDLDGDGLTDEEEDPNRNGIVDAGETDPDLADTDGDSFSDHVEVRLGTDPLDATSSFYLDYASAGEGAVQLTWPSAPGAVFEIHTSTNLTSWTTFQTGIPADSGSDSTSRTVPLSTPRIFYRIGLLPLP